MGKSLGFPKDIVRVRSGNRCEKCRVTLTGNTGGKPDKDTARSIHHRHPKRAGGRDTVVCMVNLCYGCHKGIHDDEEAAVLEGFIVLDADPARVPFLGWRGWVLPDPEGGLVLLDFGIGQAYAVDTPVQPRPRKRVARRPQYDRRKKSRKISRVA